MDTEVPPPDTYCFLMETSSLSLCIYSPTKECWFRDVEIAHAYIGKQNIARMNTGGYVYWYYINPETKFWHSMFFTSWTEVLGGVGNFYISKPTLFGRNILHRIKGSSLCSSDLRSSGHPSHKESEEVSMRKQYVSGGGYFRIHLVSSTHLG